MPLRDWLAFARELGLDGTECSLAFVEPIGRASAAEMRRLCDEAGLAVSMVTCHSDFTHPDAAERERQVEDMGRNLRLARELGAPLVRALSGQRHPGVSDEQGVAWAAEGLRRVAADGDRVGVRVAIENHTKSFFWQYFDFAQRGEVFVQLLDALRDSSVGVNFGTANPLVANEDTLELFERV